MSTGIMGEEFARQQHWGACYSCGHHNGEWETRCEKCGRPLSATRTVQRGVASAAKTARTSPHRSGNDEIGRPRRSPKIAPRPPAFPEHLRQQLQDRVQRYRSRQENRTLALPFEQEQEPPAKVISFPSPSPQIGEMRVARSRPARESRVVEAAAQHAPQPALAFHPADSPEAAWRLRPVAPLRLRLSGHLRDLQLIACGTLLFLSATRLIPYFGIRIHFSLILLGGVVCGSLLMALLYGLLFVWGAGVTPGMKSAGLRLVTFDGMPASRRQRLWRVLGAIVSAGSFLIGFLWAVVDEEKLYWHDHISKTYLTTFHP